MYIYECTLSCEFNDHCAVIIAEDKKQAQSLFYESSPTPQKGVLILKIGTASKDAQERVVAFESNETN